MHVLILKDALPYREGEIVYLTDATAERLIDLSDPIAKEISEEKAIKLWEKEIKDALKLQDQPIGVHVEFLIDFLPYRKGEQVWLSEKEVKVLTFKEIVKTISYSNKQK